MKNYPVVILLKLLVLFAMISSAQAGEDEIRKALQSAIPNATIESITKAPVLGLYEVTVNDQFFYTDAQGQYLIEGNIIDVKSRRNLTDESRRINFDKLPLDSAIKKVKGNGKRKMAYFTDPNCGFCKRLEKELAKVNDVTLYIFLYPIFEGSDEIARNVYCAKDPVKAWNDLMLNSVKPAAASCTNPIAKNKDLGRKMHVNGTPNLIFGDGSQVPGYLPAEELEKRLSDSGKN
jgi:thiol:disulfide interchange protein DsbC